jgi:hypothetical protein
MYVFAKPGCSRALASLHTEARAAVAEITPVQLDRFNYRGGSFAPLLLKNVTIF